MKTEVGRGRRRRGKETAERSLTHFKQTRASIHALFFFPLFLHAFIQFILLSFLWEREIVRRSSVPSDGD